MIIHDQLYGEFEINGVLEALINSQPVQRLKGIHQGGANYLVNERWNGTRYEHSVGVMLLIKKCNGSIEEQIAGLLHDVSHTAFSHVIDYVLEEQDEDYHEKIYKQIVEQSEIPIILEKYGYDYGDILLDHKRWSILEQDAPELCADRVDYTLRDMYSYGYITLEEAQRFLECVTVDDGLMCLTTLEAAEWFTATYYKEVIDYFMNPMAIYGSVMMTNLLQEAIRNHIVSLDDFLGTDEEVLQILRNCKNESIHKQLNQLSPHIRVIENDFDYDYCRMNKMRLIDPTIIYKNEKIKASQVSTKIKDLTKQAKRKAEKGMRIKII